MRKFLKRLLFPSNWKDLRTTEPISKVFGFDRGVPIDRYYIEKFLNQNRDVIRGRVLEIAENAYTLQFGQPGVTSEILSYSAANKSATIIGDLTKIETLPLNAVDCFICTQTFNVIYDFRKAIEGAYHVLKPGGTLLVTVPGLSQISRYDMERWGDFWRFTTKSAQLIFGEVFGNENVQVHSYGNVLAAVAFLHGLSQQEVTTAELDVNDPNYQIIITVAARKV